MKGYGLQGEGSLLGKYSIGSMITNMMMVLTP